MIANLISQTKSFLFATNDARNKTAGQLFSNGRFKYYESGQGQPLVLLYGLFGSVKNYQEAIDHFSHSYRVIVPELPIYDLGLKANVTSLMEHVADLLKVLKIDQTHLVGNSLGGHVALLLTLKYPALVNSLVLVGSSGLYENGMGDSFPKRGDYAYIKTKTEQTFYLPTTASEELIDEIYQTVNNRYKAIQILSMAKSTIRYNLKDQLSRIACPSCIIWGRQDQVTPPEVAETFYSLIPNSTIYWIDQCGHVPMLEQPELFNQYLSSFLQRIPNDRFEKLLG